ncbi:MAG: protease pro-enzyme activation domain-containing protein [Terriglobales bacterium]
MIRRLSVFLLTVVALVSGLNVLCQAQSQTLLTSHVREVTLNGKAPLVGQLPATQTIHFDIVMALSHPAELKSFLQEVYDPSSPSYRHFVTVPEFTERFGPSQKDYDAVIRFAKANGFKVTRASRDAFDIQLKGTVASVEKAFHVSLGVYQHPTENRTFFAPDREPTVNLPFQLWHITGLDNYSIPRPALVRRPESQAKSQATTGSCPDQSFCGSDMRAAYYGNGSLNGSGQNLGLLEYAGYDIVDVNTYYEGANQTLNVPIVGISTDGTPILCTEAGGCDDTEQTLDITQAAGMAPNLNTIYVYVGSSDTALLGAMSSDTPLPAQLSASWTWNPNPGADDIYFQKMASQGQTYFNASGDSGAYKGDAPWPPNSQYVQAVGGTDLETSGAAGPWASETAWVDGGGGWGTNVDIPSWQQLPGVITAANEGSTVYRDVPDVSANANFTFYVCADQSGLSGCTANDYGGTSFASPMWAAYIALANQQGAANGVPLLGFINPAVYNLGVSSGYDAAFHDIVSGSDGLPTTVGYDLATGWGSPNGAGLIDALTGPQAPGFSLAASPGSVGLAQGGSATSTITVTDGGGFNGSVTLSASGLPSGVTAAFSPNPATSISTLTLTASGSAATGTFPVTISGKSGSLTSETSLSVTVNPLATGVSISPTSLAFATTVVGATSTAKNVTLTNAGSVTLVIAGFTTSANFGTKTATGKTPCGATLAAGKTCQIGVTFNPTQVGALTGTLSVSDNASNSPQTVSLSGTGRAQAAITPATATFAATTVGTTSVAKTFTLHNYQSVILRNIAISTTGNFSVSSTTCQAQLTSSATCTINVVFTPTATGTTTGPLSVSDTATNSPQTSSLTGTGKAPKN